MQMKSARRSRDRVCSIRNAHLKEKIKCWSFLSDALLAIFVLINNTFFRRIYYKYGVPWLWWCLILRCGVFGGFIIKDLEQLWDYIVWSHGLLEFHFIILNPVSYSLKLTFDALLGCWSLNGLRWTIMADKPRAQRRRCTNDCKRWQRRCVWRLVLF